MYSPSSSSPRYGHDRSRRFSLPNPSVGHDIYTEMPSGRSSRRQSLDIQQNSAFWEPQGIADSPLQRPNSGLVGLGLNTIPETERVASRFDDERTPTVSNLDSFHRPSPTLPPAAYGSPAVRQRAGFTNDYTYSPPPSQLPQSRNSISDFTTQSPRLSRLAYIPDLPTVPHTVTPDQFYLPYDGEGRYLYPARRTADAENPGIVL